MQHPQKYVAGEVYFLPADKHESFPQVDSITLGVRSLACPNTENGKFTISLEHVKQNVKDEVDFLPTDKRQRFPQTDAIILSVWPGMPKLPKITSLLFLCNI